jgi:hypothetical protein
LCSCFFSNSLKKKRNLKDLMEFSAVPSLTSGHHHTTASQGVRGGAAAAQRKKKPQLSTPVSTRHSRVGGHQNVSTPTGASSTTITTVSSSAAARRKSQSELERRQLEPPAASDHPRQPVAATVAASSTSPLFHTPSGGSSVTRGAGALNRSVGAASSDDENFEPCLSVQRPRFAELFESGGTKDTAAAYHKPSGSVASPLRFAGRSLPPLAPAAAIASSSPLVTSRKPPLHTTTISFSSPNVNRSLIHDSDYSEEVRGQAICVSFEDGEEEEHSPHHHDALDDVTPVLEDNAPRPHPQQQHLSPGRSQPLPPRPASRDPPLPTPQWSTTAAAEATIAVTSRFDIEEGRDERQGTKRLFLEADPEVSRMMLDPSDPTSDDWRSEEGEGVQTPDSPIFELKAATTATMAHTDQGADGIPSPVTDFVIASGSPTRTAAPKSTIQEQGDGNLLAARRRLAEGDNANTAARHQLPEPACDAQAVAALFAGALSNQSEPSLPLHAVSKPLRPVRRGGGGDHATETVSSPPSSVLPVVGEQSQDELRVAAAASAAAAENERKWRRSAEQSSPVVESTTSVRVDHSSSSLGSSMQSSRGRALPMSPPSPSSLPVEASHAVVQSSPKRSDTMAANSRGTSPKTHKHLPAVIGSAEEYIVPTLVVVERSSPSASATTLDLSLKSNHSTSRAISPNSRHHTPQGGVAPSGSGPNRGVSLAPPADDNTSDGDSSRRGTSVASTSSSSSSQHVATSTTDDLGTLVSNPTPVADQAPLLPSSVASSDKASSSAATAPRTPTQQARASKAERVSNNRRVPPQEPYLVREPIIKLVNASLSASPVAPSLRSAHAADAIRESVIVAGHALTETGTDQQGASVTGDNTAARSVSVDDASTPAEAASATSAARGVGATTPPTELQITTETAISTTANLIPSSPRRRSAASPNASVNSPTHRQAQQQQRQVCADGNDGNAIASTQSNATPQLVTFDVFAPTDNTDASTLLNLSSASNEPPLPPLLLGRRAARNIDDVSVGHVTVGASPDAAAPPIVAADESVSGISMFSQQLLDTNEGSERSHHEQIGGDGQRRLTAVGLDDGHSEDPPLVSSIAPAQQHVVALSPPVQVDGSLHMPPAASFAALDRRSLTNDDGGSSNPFLNDSRRGDRVEESDATSADAALVSVNRLSSTATANHHHHHDDDRDDSFDGLRASMRSDDAESPFMVTTTATAEPSPKSPLAGGAVVDAADDSPSRRRGGASRSPKNDAVQRALKECFDTIAAQHHQAAAQQQNILASPSGSPMSLEVLRRANSSRHVKKSSPLRDPHYHSPKKLSLPAVEDGVDAADFVSDGTPLKRNNSTSMTVSSPWKKPPTSPAPPNMRHSFQFSEPPMFAEGSSPTASLNARRGPSSGGGADGRVPSFSPENKSPVQAEESDPNRSAVSDELSPKALVIEGDYLRRSTSQDSGGGGVSAADREALEEHLRALDAAETSSARRPTSSISDSHDHHHSAAGLDSIEFSFPYRKDEAQLQQLALMQQRNQRKYCLRQQHNGGTQQPQDVDDEYDEESDDYDGQTRMVDVNINISLAPALYKKTLTDNSPSRQRQLSEGIARLDDVFMSGASRSNPADEEASAALLVPSAQPIVRVQQQQQRHLNRQAAASIVRPTTLLLLDGADDDNILSGWTVVEDDDAVSLPPQEGPSRSPFPKAKVAPALPTTPPTSAVTFPHESFDGARALVLAPVSSSILVAGNSSAAVVVVGSHIASGVDTATSLIPPPIFPNMYQDIAVVDPRAISEEWREGLRQEPPTKSSWMMHGGLLGNDDNILGTPSAQQPQTEEVIGGDDVDVYVSGGHSKRKRLTALPTIVVGKQRPFGFVQPTNVDDATSKAGGDRGDAAPQHRNNFDGGAAQDEDGHPVEWMTPPPSSRPLRQQANKALTPLHCVALSPAGGSVMVPEPLAVSRRSVNNNATATTTTVSAYQRGDKDSQDHTQRRQRVLRAIGTTAVAVDRFDEMRLSPLDDTIAFTAAPPPLPLLPSRRDDGAEELVGVLHMPAPPHHPPSASSIGSSAASLLGDRQDSEASPNIRMPLPSNEFLAEARRTITNNKNNTDRVGGAGKHAALFAPAMDPPQAAADGHHNTSHTSDTTSNFSTSGPRFLLENLIATQQQRQKTRQAALVSPSTNEAGDEAAVVAAGGSSATLAFIPNSVMNSSAPTFEALAARRHEMRLKSIHTALSSIQRDRAEADERHLRRGSPHSIYERHSTTATAAVFEEQQHHHRTYSTATTAGSAAAATTPPIVIGATAAATTPAWAPRPLPVAVPTDSALFARDMRKVLLGLRSSAAGLSAPPSPAAAEGDHHHSVVLTPHSFIITGDE